MKKCPVCGVDFEGRKKYCSYSCRNKYISTVRDYSKKEWREKISKARLNHESKKVKKPKIEIKCLECDNKISYFEHQKRKPIFCSRSCSNKNRWKNKEFKEKVSKNISSAVKKKWNDPIYAEKVIKNSTNKNKCFSSKGEREVKKFFEEKYFDYEWKSGGSIKSGDYRISRDLYSDKLKVCIEYDGIWHFKDINVQLKHKQNVDKALEIWCIENEYRLIRFSDFKYRENEEKMLNILVNEVFNGTNKVVKFY